MFPRACDHRIDSSRPPEVGDHNFMSLVGFRAAARLREMDDSLNEFKVFTELQNL